MASPAAFQGTYSDMRIVKSRKVIQVVVELPVEQGQAFVAAFGVPDPATETWVAIARLDPKAKQPEPEKPSRRWDQMSPTQQAGIRCNEPTFWAFIREDRALPCETSEDAAEFVRTFCGVTSRSDLNRDEATARAWHDLDGQYLAWLRWAA